MCRNKLRGDRGNKFWSPVVVKYRVIQKDGLNHVVGQSFCLYTDSLFAPIGDSNDKCSSSLETHAPQQSPTQF